MNLERTSRGPDCGPTTFYAGGETSYEDWVYLELMEPEWERTKNEPQLQRPMYHTQQIPMGTSIVLLFWTYFETRIEHLLRAALKTVPPRFLEGRCGGIQRSVPD